MGRGWRWEGKSHLRPTFRLSASGEQVRKVPDGKSKCQHRELSEKWKQIGPSSLRSALRFAQQEATNELTSKSFAPQRTAKKLCGGFRWRRKLRRKRDDEEFNVNKHGNILRRAGCWRRELQLKTLPSCLSCFQLVFPPWTGRYCHDYSRTCLTYSFDVHTSPQPAELLTSNLESSRSSSLANGSPAVRVESG